MAGPLDGLDLPTMTCEEAEILIAVLVFAEGAATVESPSMVEALNALRPWRSRLLQAYLRSRYLPSAESAVTP